MMDLLKEDVDRLLSYNTKQQVNILDRWLGLTCIFIQLGIVCYVALYVFVMRNGYLLYEQSKGVATTSVFGDVLATASGSSEPRYFNADDLVYPPLENGNIFLATKMAISMQERGVCEDMSMPCAKIEDCSKPPEGSSWKPECMPSGFCKEPSWCTDDGTVEEYALDVANFQVWIRTALQFIQLNQKAKENKIFGSHAVSLEPLQYKPSGKNAADVEDPARKAGYNTFLVTDLLNLCDPPVRIEEVSELGAAIEITFKYDCNVASDISKCPGVISAKRIDAVLDPFNIGYAFSYPEYVGKDKRRLHSVRGLRFYIRTSGIGELADVGVIILMLSTGVALLNFAPVFTDLLMLYGFKLKKKYYARKYDHSQDFSELLPKDEEEELDDEEEEDDM